MAKSERQSDIFGKYKERGRKAWDQHSNDDLDDANFGELPAGLNGAVAQLWDAKLGTVAKGKQNEGEPYVYFAGIVKYPENFVDSKGNVHHIEGLRTSVTEMLCDTPNSGGKRKTFEAHLEFVENLLGRLGVDRSEMGFDDLPTKLEELKEDKPYFRFRTWAGSQIDIELRTGKWYAVDRGTAKIVGGPFMSEAIAKTAYPFAGKEPRVQHTWGKRCDAPPGAGDNGLVDATPGGIAPSPEEEAGEPEPPAGGPSPDLEFGDIDSLVEAATAKDKAAGMKLQSMALAAGYTKQEVRDADSWAAVGEMVQSPKVAPEGEPEGEPEDAGEVEGEEAGTPESAWAPGDMCYYKPLVMGPNKKLVRSRKAVECEVLTVGDGKVTLRRMDTNKTVLDVRGKPLQVAEGEVDVAPE